MPELPPINLMEVPARLPVFWCGLNHHIDALVKARQAIEEVRLMHPDSTPSNVQAVYMSPWKSHLMSPNFKPLIEIVEQAVRDISRDYMKGDLEALNFDVKVSDCWGVIYDKTDLTIAHHHYPSDWSAVIYLEAQPGCAPIIFGDGLGVDPQPGLMVIFPGNMIHAVPENQAHRVCVAMNLMKFPTIAF